MMYIHKSFKKCDISNALDGTNGERCHIHSDNEAAIEKDVESEESESDE